MSGWVSCDELLFVLSDRVSCWLVDWVGLVVLSGRLSNDEEISSDKVTLLSTLDDRRLIFFLLENLDVLVPLLFFLLGDN